MRAHALAGTARANVENRQRFPGSFAELNSTGQSFARQPTPLSFAANGLTLLRLNLEFVLTAMEFAEPERVNCFFELMTPTRTAVGGRIFYAQSSYRHGRGCARDHPGGNF